METEPANGCAWVPPWASPCYVSGWNSGHGTGFSSSTSFLPFSIILSVLHTHPTPNTTLIKRRNRQRLGAFINSNAFLNIRWHCTGQFCHTVIIQNINVQANILQFSTSCNDSNKSVPIYIYIYMSWLLQYHPTAMSTLSMALSLE